MRIEIGANQYKYFFIKENPNIFTHITRLCARVILGLINYLIKIKVCMYSNQAYQAYSFHLGRHNY